jgi:hypothetical protein
MMGGDVGHWLHVGAQGRGLLIANRDSRSRSRDHPRANTRRGYQDRGIVELRICQRQQDRHPYGAGAAS